MAHVGEEGALGNVGCLGLELRLLEQPIGGFEVGGTLANSFFKAVVEVLDFKLGQLALGDVLERATQLGHLAVFGVRKTLRANPDVPPARRNERQLQIVGRTMCTASLYGSDELRLGFRRIATDAHAQFRLDRWIDLTDAVGFLRPIELVAEQINFPSTDSGHCIGA